jgi:hypothetical protein
MHINGVEFRLSMIYECEEAPEIEFEGKVPVRLQNAVISAGMFVTGLGLVAYAGAGILSNHFGIDLGLSIGVEGNIENNLIVAGFGIFFGYLGVESGRLDYKDCARKYYVNSSSKRIGYESGTGERGHESRYTRIESISQNENKGIDIQFLNIAGKKNKMRTVGLENPSAKKRELEEVLLGETNE